jgi:acetoin utilization protein AcuC
MTVALVYDAGLEAYAFPAGHPMTPARFRLAVGLMRAWGLIAEAGDEGAAPGVDAPATDAGSHPPVAVTRAALIAPRSAADAELLLVHTPGYVDAVKAISADPARADGRVGIGPGLDTPAFPGMHEAAALVTGASITAMDVVLEGRATRAFNPAGGMHHAHADRAAGFCIYNDPAVAIECATREHAGLRVAYVDIDAHHGDGVEEAFRQRSDVLTLSVHETGRYAYPGTGHVRDIGEGEGRGFALNVPLPLYAGPESFRLVTERIIVPALAAFRPDVVFLQAGADAHSADPLVQLENTVEGFTDTVEGVVRAADELCDGRLVMTGGGGYEPYSAVPRQWACAMAVLMGVEVPLTLPVEWLRASAEAARGTRGRREEPGDAHETPVDPAPTFLEAASDVTPDEQRAALAGTHRVIEELLDSHPLFRREGRCLQ